MLNAHFSLVAILSISLIKVVKNFLLHSDFGVSRFFLCLFCCNFEVDFRAQGSEVFVKSLLASEWMVGVENIKWLHVELITPRNHL